MLRLFRFSLPVFIVAILVWQAAATGSVLTLEQSIRQGLDKNEKLKQYEERLEQKESYKREATGNFLPVISLSGRYSHLNEPMRIDLSPIRNAMIQMQSGTQVELADINSRLQGAGSLSQMQRQVLQSQYTTGLEGALPPFSMTFKEQNFRIASVLGIQPLFMGGKLIAARRYAAAENAAAAAEVKKVKNEIEAGIMGRYFTALLLGEVVQVRTGVLDGMIRHLESAEKLFAGGLIAKHDLLRAKVAVAEAEENIMYDRNRRETALTALKSSIGADRDMQVELADKLAFAACGNTLDELLAAVEMSQPLLEIIRHKITAADQNYAAERSRLMPTVAAFGKYELYPEDLSTLEPRWIVGLEVSFNLFEGMKRYNRLQAAEHIRKEAAYLQMDSRRNINLWIEKAYREVENERTRYEKLEANCELAFENVRQNEKRFQTGLGTSLEVIDARLRLESNRLKRLSALHAYYLSLVDLYTAVGKTDSVLEIWLSREDNNENK